MPHRKNPTPTTSTVCRHPPAPGGGGIPALEGASAAWARNAAVLFACLAAAGSTWAAASGDAPPRERVLAAMRRATAFMVEKVSCEGGYVWTYLPDFSRRWGEMEARPTMIWIQGAGTPAMGQVFLDAWEATGDDFYYEAARRAGEALIRGQHPAGGWNYVIDFAGEESLRSWYDTVGRNGWRLEEFQHYYGNATFDDSNTADAARLLLRLHLARRDAQVQAALERAIQFVLDAQYPNGGWPQRFPLMGGFSKDGNPDYTGSITFNDGVADENIDFLLACHAALGGDHLLDPIRRGMEAYLLAQQPAPQAGWALQYTPDLQPAGARTYEPRALATHGTYACVEQLLRFHRLTGDPRFLARIPEALAWLEGCRLTDWETPAGRSGDALPTFVELGSNRPLFLHRTGSNAVNGHYFADHDPENLVGHYGSVRYLDLGGLRARYEAALAPAPVDAAKDSPLRAGAVAGAGTPPAPGRPGPEPRRRRADPSESPPERLERVLATLNAEGWWPAQLGFTSHPYRGDGPAAPAAGDFAGGFVGDDFDTSPHPSGERIECISTAAYIRNMGVLIRSLDGAAR